MSKKEEEKKDESAAHPSAIFDFLRVRVQRAFKHLKQDKFTKGFDNEENTRIVNEFCKSEKGNNVVLAFTGDNVRASFGMPSTGKGRSIYFIKRPGTVIDEKNIASELRCGEMSSESLLNLEKVLQEVYVPLITNPANQDGWGEVMSKNVTDGIHTFLANVSITLAHTKGETSLPMPPMQDFFTPSPPSHNKDRVHLLENAIIIWTKQIKNVLKQDSEQLLKQGLHPGPYEEIKFWKKKSRNLNAIHKQLQSPEVRAVLDFLDRSKSTYCTPFAKLCREIFTAKIEANDNTTFLEPLETWFEALGSGDFMSIRETFRPIMCAILCIWKHSKHYNIPGRLVVLIREICNALVKQATDYLSGEAIFQMISDEEGGKAVDMLKIVLKVCGFFKSVYFDYKAKASQDCPENPWRIQNNALFMRLDSFLERCHDILDLTQTIVQFSRLEKIEVGGTKGKSLTTTVEQTYHEFVGAVETFKAVTYDIMDVSAKQFDDDFYEFRCRIKELERRLGSVLTQGFDDCPTIGGRFKLLDSFEGLLERPIIQDELERKHIALIQAYGEDLKLTQETFLMMRDNPPIAANYPPMSGAITWCRGLMDRILGPMQKLEQIGSTNKGIMDREEAKEVKKVYSNVLESFEEYVQIKIEEWGRDVETSSEAKLKLPLLRKLEQQYRGYNTLAVNFDPGLVRLLREVKYFLLLGLEVPDSALQIYKKAEVFRRQTGNLDLIVNMYNSMIKSLLPVEEPLVKGFFTNINNTVKRGLANLTWKSHGIDSFLSDSMTQVNGCFAITNTLKKNLAQAGVIMDSWTDVPLFKRTEKPRSFQEFEEDTLRALRVARFQVIKEGGNGIHQLVKESNKILKVSQGLPDWKAYVDFVNNIVVSGLSKVVVVSLQALLEEVDPARIKKLDKSPMIEIAMDLQADRVVFTPNLFSDESKKSKKVSVRNIVDGWVDSFYKPGTIVRRLDGAGTFTKELKEGMHVRAYTNKINKAFSVVVRECEEFQQTYNEFSHLWLEDMQATFDAFLVGATTETTASGLKLYNIELFDAEIARYRDIQSRIADLRTPTDIGWLRINSQPIKQALNTQATKWNYMFSQHLHNDIVQKLTDLHNVCGKINDGLGVEVVDGDLEALMDVMGHIRDVRKRVEETNAMFEPLRETINLLKKHGVSMDGAMIGDDELMDNLENAPMKWEIIVNKAYKKKETIMPMQNAEADQIKSRLTSFVNRIKAFRTEFRNNAPFAFTQKAVDEAYQSIDEYYARLCDLKREAVDFNNLEDLFELEISTWRDLDNTETDLKLLKSLWDLKSVLLSNYGNWKKQLWADIDTDDLDDQNKKLTKEIKNFGVANTIVRGWTVYKDLETLSKDMATVLPLINDLHSDAMRPRHWKNLCAVCKAKPVDPKNPKFCLDDLLNMKLHLQAEAVSEIVETADKELKIDKKLIVIDQTWQKLEVEYVQHKDTEQQKLKVPDEVVEYLEGHQLELQTMIGMGKFVDYFRDVVTKWQKTLGMVETNLKLWSSVTKTWSSLESIFLTSEDIRGQLPEDTKRFEQIDSSFKEIMSASVEIPNVVQVCSQDEMEESLREMIAALEVCQKALNEYLDMKKKIFPRFYFVSNVALLDILSNGNNPPKIMPYVSDCYDAIKELVFVEGSKNEAHTMIAKDGEEVPFPEVFHISGAVENWLNDLTAAMVGCLKVALNAGLEAALQWGDEHPRHMWVFDFPAQVILQTSLIDWTEITEKSLEEFINGDEDAVRNALEKFNYRMENLIKLVQGELKKPDRAKIITLITLDVHGRDVVNKLVTDKCEGPEAFLWQQQLRFYWMAESRDSKIKICDYRTDYSYEYIGNTGRLVITPLTDRCYITLTTAMRLMLGGAPAGPAGTGKTETTKDLARALALPCYVFNCSDQMNYQTLADIFRGLSQTGGWGCFDEFNRIPIEVLSVVATQVKTILDAMAFLAIPSNREVEFQSLPAGQPPCKVGTFDFMGDIISLVPTCSFYITMNPGYAGRTELPENVKVLFRSCAMIRPDLVPICEIMLMAEGFVQARVLSIKFVTLYTLCDELLSKQAHYDWGLRAVKSVLRVAGILKRASPESDEEPVLMRALRDFNTPKIPAKDTPIFLRLIEDLFPKYAKTTPPVINAELKAMASKVSVDRGLQADEAFCVKVVQFQELLDVRHSVMLIGPGGCGKSTIWQALVNCHNEGKEKRTCVAEAVNPKSVTSDELYGYMTLAKDWKDGVLSIMMRGMCKNDRDLGYYDYQTYKWVVLDGDIDAVWIESMNTVMDDNKVLTLVSNERIPLTPAMRMVFEIDSLANATPATVSRAGILFINATDIGYKPYIDSWIQKRSPVERARFPTLFQRYIDTIFDVMRKGYEDIIPIRPISKVTTACNLLDAILTPITDDSKKSPENLEAVFVWACIWAFGGTMTNSKSGNHRRNFSMLWQDTFQFVKIPVAENKTVFDYFYDIEAGKFTTWTDIVSEYIAPTELQFSEVIVQTDESTRLTYALNLLASVHQPVMFVGTAGTGKTTIVKDYLRNLDEEAWMTQDINMNYYTDSYALQQQLEGSIDKRSGHTFGPPTGKHLLYFIDDLNLPYIEEYGTQNSLSLLKQHIDYETFFDRVDLGFRKRVVDVQYVTAMNPTAGSFTITERLQRNFATFACMMPGSEDLYTIYSNILEGHMLDFNSATQGCVSPIVEATVFLLQQVTDKFLPSAIKFVYNWNMREITNVMQGICRTTHNDYNTPCKLIRLWLHECNRVFEDRLINEMDLTRFNDLLVESSKRYFSEIKVGTGANDTVEVNQDELHQKPLIFTSFANSTTGEPIYLPVTDNESIGSTMRTKLSEYNDANTVMDLVLFQAAVDHVCRITRILDNPCGNAMLVGVGGSGKQSLAKLATFICQFDIRQLNVSSSFKIDDLKEALKEMYIKAGVKGNSIVFMMTDAQIINDKFLVYINGILSSGWIPDLFAKDEMDGIFSGIRGEAKAAGIQDTPAANTEFFISRVRKYLHVVLCFSPVGPSFRVRARRFPGLVNCTVIDHFHPWPRDALVSVAAKFLEDVEIEGEGVKENVAYHMAEVHLTSTAVSSKFLQATRRYNYTTPKSFLELIAFYKQILAEKREGVVNQINRLGTGLAKLRETAADVAALQEDLKKTMVVVEEKKASTNVLLEKMGKEQAAAEQEQAKAATEKEKANAASAEAAAIEAQAQKELEEAKPAMDAAAEAVNCLNKNSLTELKNLAKPPSGVDLVTKGCLMMLEGEFKNHKWDRAKKMMADVGKFLERLKSFDARELSDRLVDELTKLTSNELMNYDAMMKKSSAAANLVNWVLNTYKYNRIYVKVAPLMLSLEQAQASKAAAEKKLESVLKVVAKVEARVADLNKIFLEATMEKQKVEAEAAACLARLDLANRLVGGLSSENKRWGEEIDRLKDSERSLVGNTLLSSAFTSYIGAFDGAFRLTLWRDMWLPDIASRDIPHTEGIKPLDMLVDEGKIAVMNSEGLPEDPVSIENGSIIVSSARWPLIIDPQLQGIKWLRRRLEMAGEKKAAAAAKLKEAEQDDIDDFGTDGEDEPEEPIVASLEVLQLQMKDWVRRLKHCISMGTPVILDNVGEDLDATLNPVLARATFKKGKKLYLKFGGEEIEYDPKFQMYICTKLPNPHYSPEVLAQATLINFIATESGLEEQLLARVVNNERPDLEAQKQELQEKFNKYKITLIALEDQLLQRLANAPDDILSDVPLIEGLEETKRTANEINEAVKLGKQTELDINKSRELYRVVASEASMLYFMISTLSSVDAMYQYSLDAYIQFFNKGMRDANNSDDVATRAANLVNCLRLTIYTWVSRGLFEDHKIIFMALITFELMRRKLLSEEIVPSHFDFLIRAPKNFSEENTLDWLPNDAWQTVLALSQIDDYSRLSSDMLEAPGRFQSWFSHATPEDEKLPLDWSALEKLPFQKLLVIRALRPDRMTVAVNNFVRKSLPAGNDFVDCDGTLNSAQVLAASLKDSSPITPIYFILSPGVDVVGDLDKMAGSEEYNMIKGATYHNVSMGQGQDIIAMERLEVAHSQGHWVILNNVHLMPRWLIELEKKLDQFAQEGSDEKFRLFLSSDPAKNIPIGILARCIKLTNEPPAGLKANLKRAFCSFPKEYINEVESKTRSIIFGLCHFHSIFVLRKKFGPKGFNMMYPFSLGDLRDSSVCLANYMESAPSKIPWADLRYIFGQIIYGGHIVNDWDRVLGMTYLEFYMKDELLDEMELFPFCEQEKSTSFKAPQSTSYDRYIEHIDENIKGDTPLAFGLHPNAEIDFRTTQSNTLFAILQDLQPRAETSSGEENTATPQGVAENVVNEIMDRFGDKKFELEEIESSLDEKGPYQNVFLQECEIMNNLLVEMIRSLAELNQGFAGELTMSDAMESLMNSFYVDKVPAKWGSLAWASQRSLSLWLADLTARIDQLMDWTGNPADIPVVTWLAGFSNPQSFLTAIKQMTAQRTGDALDKLIVWTDITKKYKIDEIEAKSRDGAYVNGLSMEGARWSPQDGSVEKAVPREMFSEMPIITCKAILTEKSSTSNIYQCPVYKTIQRGPTFVFVAQLKTKSPPARWTMAGVALLLDVSG